MYWMGSLKLVRQTSPLHYLLECEFNTKALIRKTWPKYFYSSAILARVPHGTQAHGIPPSPTSCIHQPHSGTVPLLMITRNIKHVFNTCMLWNVKHYSKYLAHYTAFRKFQKSIPLHYLSSSHMHTSIHTFASRIIQPLEIFKSTHPCTI